MAKTAKKSEAPQTGDIVHLYSTLANDQLYTIWGKGGADIPHIVHQVLVKGGAGIASKNLITPLGVHTPVSREDYEQIKDLAGFKAHVENGYLRVEESKVDIDAIVADMNGKDASSPLTEADYADAPKDGSVAIPSVMKE